MLWLSFGVVQDLVVEQFDPTLNPGWINPGYIKRDSREAEEMGCRRI